MLQRMKGYWLYALGVFVVTFGSVVELLDQLALIDLSPLLGTFLPEKHVGAVIAGIGVAKIVLRLATAGVAALLAKVKQE